MTNKTELVDASRDIFEFIKMLAQESGYGPDDLLVISSILFGCSVAFLSGCRDANGKITREAVTRLARANVGTIIETCKINGYDLNIPYEKQEGENVERVMVVGGEVVSVN